MRMMMWWFVWEVVGQYLGCDSRVMGVGGCVMGYRW
jgi:hypothetical protein